jgi:thioredoxin-related protein
MKTQKFLFPCLLALSCFSFVCLNFLGNNELSIHSALPMPDHQMKDVSGRDVSLGEIKTDKGILVIFSCNTCPYVIKSQSRVKEISELCLASGIGCVLVNSNEAQRGEEDSFEKMVSYHAAQNLRCNYVTDAKSQLANAFGAAYTPQCFLFGVKGLVYKGAIDDNIKDPTTVTNHYLKDAIQAMLKGKKPPMQETKAIGCTIKRLD